MKLPRRKFLHLVAGATGLPAVSHVARAQAYPTRPITMIVPFAPGGISDVMGRMMAEPMRAFLGQPVIIENVGGAAGSILSGGLPPGLSLSKSGLISGTPTVAGNWSFWVELSDEDPPSAAWCVPEKSQRAFTIDVMPGLFIQQQSLAPTIRGVPYGFQLTAAGGGTQTWSIASGQLPPGITLASSGALSGTPTQTGAFTFVVKVTDGTVRSDTETLTLRVVDPLSVTGPTSLVLNPCISNRT